MDSKDKDDTNSLVQENNTTRNLNIHFHCASFNLLPTYGAEAFFTDIYIVIKQSVNLPKMGSALCTIKIIFG
jgi:hypothetical protein